MATRAVMTVNEERTAGRRIEQYPLRLFAAHMAEIFGISIAQFYAREALGDFLFAEIKPRIGRKSWSRDRVAAYLAGTLATAPARLRRVK